MEKKDNANIPTLWISTFYHLSKLKVSFQSFQKADALFRLHFECISLIDLFIVNVTHSFFMCEAEDGCLSAS